MKNSYPGLPKLTYRKTTVPMAEVVVLLRGMALPVEVKRATYIVFRIESANGTKGINNNYGGIQADSGGWGKDYDPYFCGTVELKENGTGNLRLFLAFKDTATFLHFLAAKLQARGLYVGGHTSHLTSLPVTTPEALALAYEREWVKGDALAPLPKAKLETVESMYKQAAVLFAAEKKVTEPVKAPEGKK